jgi:hypothetical protein
MDKGIISKILCCLIGISSFSYIGLRVVGLVKEKDLYIAVKGLSDRVVASDVAVCHVRISRDTDHLKSVQGDRQKDKKLIVKFLKEKGFEESAIEEMPTNVENNFRYYDKSKSRYSIIDNITVKSSNVELIKKAAIELLAYMDSNGSGIVTCDTKYRYTNINELKLEMIREATIDAQNRAKQIAETVGSSVIRLRNLATGPFSIVSADSSASSDYDDYEGRDSIMKRVRVVVHSSFSIK